MQSDAYVTALTCVDTVSVLKDLDLGLCCAWKDFFDILIVLARTTVRRREREAAERARQEEERKKKEAASGWSPFAWFKHESSKEQFELEVCRHIFWYPLKGDAWHCVLEPLNLAS